MILAVDTSTRALGVSLYNEPRVLTEMIWISKNHHTIELASSVDQALGQIGAGASELQAISVAIGPGSFTGLRIGLAFAKGLALSHRLPIIGIPTLDIIAAALPVPPSSMLAAVLEAGRRRLAIGWYRAQDGEWKQEGDLQNLTIEEFIETITTPILVCGELNGEVRERLKPTNCIIPSPTLCVRRPAILAEMAWKHFQSGDFDNPATLKPIYLHHGEPIPE